MFLLKCWKGLYIYSTVEENVLILQSTLVPVMTEISLFPSFVCPKKEVNVIIKSFLWGPHPTHYKLLALIRSSSQGCMVLPARYKYFIASHLVMRLLGSSSIVTRSSPIPSLQGS